jgi:uncharacterized protein (TIGR02145 family)
MKRRRIIWLCYLILTGLILNNGCNKELDIRTNDFPVDKAIDKQGNIYKTVMIGTQLWMAENLKTTMYSNGDPIPTAAHDISNEAEPKYQWAYDNDSNKVAVYGRLYTWYAVTDSRNICPDGWHVPSDHEWETLRLTLGNDSTQGGKLKEAGFAHWRKPNAGATNETGFTALPGGYLSFEGEFVEINVSGWFWSSSDNSPLAWGRALHNDDNIIFRWGFHKTAGVSVRCLRNN